MERDAVESMQGNLHRGWPAIFASYGLRVLFIRLRVFAGALRTRATVRKS